MRDVFYTILVVWIVWRIINAFSSSKTKAQNTTSNSAQYPNKKEGETTVDFMPQTSNATKLKDDAGEYVDYEEIK